MQETRLKFELILLVLYSAPIPITLFTFSFSFFSVFLFVSALPMTLYTSHFFLGPWLPPLDLLFVRFLLFLLNNFFFIVLLYRQSFRHLQYLFKNCFQNIVLFQVFSHCRPFLGQPWWFVSCIYSSIIIFWLFCHIYIVLYHILLNWAHALLPGIWQPQFFFFLNNWTYLL